jgi:Zn finger protein HypA/HybF involved in hydrogenase expression
MDIKEEIENGIKNGETMANISDRLNIPFSTFKRKAKKLGLYKPNQGRSGINRSKEEKDKRRISLELILIGEHKMTSSSLKKRLFEEGIKKEVCEICGVNNIWEGRILSLHLDHIDGDKYNNKLCNIRILCPNCHSQTDTFAGRNVRLKNIKNNHVYCYVKKHNTIVDYWDDKKDNWNNEQQKYIKLVTNSGIDFSKFGWVTKLSKIINQKPQKVNKWMERIMPDFYKGCYKRKCRNGGMVDTMGSKLIT